MTLGTDIKEVLEEVGAAITVLRSAGDISGEFFDFDLNAQVTKPFIREFFLEAMVSYDTNAVLGDVVEIDETGERYIVMNKTPELVENAVMNYSCVFYKTNVSGELLRPSGEVRSSQTYHKQTIFNSVGAECFALMTEPLFSGDLDTDEQLGLIGIKKDELYIPKSYGIKALDRYQPVSGEYYIVESIKTRRYPGVDVAILGEDTR